jgi:single-stranded-DNA-specific exonuclease
MTVWYEPPNRDIPADFARAIGGSPLVAQILFQRGCTTVEAARSFLDPAHYTPTPPGALPDLTKAVDILDHTLRANQPVLVWGDFDVDGQTATALLVSALRALGGSVTYYIPHRLRESHGIQTDSLRQQIAAHRPAVLLTCDTGVSAHEAVDEARAQGITTLITDHHDLPDTLPQADAVVNPKRLLADHPLVALPGVGVAYKLIESLYTQRGLLDELPALLDLVALGIVADVAVQQQDTRYLLQLGLEQLRQTQRAGLRALIDVAGARLETLSAGDIAFQLGPRLNAAGRLGDAAPAVELLTTADAVRAEVLAVQLEGLNTQRRLQTHQIRAAAQEQIAADPSLLDWEALVLMHPTWHPGIIGIVAGQLAERYQRPVVLLAVGEDGFARGSARSVPGYDIGAAIAAQADLLLRFGGHPGAAGLFLAVDQVPALRRRLSNTLRATHDPSVRTGIQLDAEVDLDDLSFDLVTDLQRLAPFGEGNPRITFAARDLRLLSAAYLGRTEQHRRLTVETRQGYRHSVLWWNSADLPQPDERFDLAYQVEINTFRGKQELQVVLVDHRRSAAAPPEVVRPRQRVLDYRQTLDPAAALAEVLDEFPQAVVWAEGYRRDESPGLPLAELEPADTLVVYSIPASPHALQNALERVKPAVVALLAVNPPLYDLNAVQVRLLQLVKYVLNQQDGVTTLTALGAAVGQSPVTVRHALDYFAARGELSVEHGRRAAVTISHGSGKVTPGADEKLDALRAAFTETAAYHAYFRRADPGRLLGWQPVESNEAS